MLEKVHKTSYTSRYLEPCEMDYGDILKQRPQLMGKKRLFQKETY